jgi:hypothetical protein
MGIPYPEETAVATWARSAWLGEEENLPLLRFHRGYPGHALQSGDLSYFKLGHRTQKRNTCLV